MDLAIAVERARPGAAYLPDGRGGIAQWRDQRAQPTPAELQAAWDAYQAEQTAAAQAETARLADMTAARALVVQTAASAVGVRFDALSTIQLRALVAVLFWQNGALDAAGAVRPLGQWVRQS